MFGISAYLLTIVVAWFLAHTVKYTVAVLRGRKPSLVRQFFISGGMPSSHAATSVALLTVVGLRDGLESGLFGLAMLFTLIVCYDAVKVRRSSGEQGLAIIALIEEGGSKVQPPRAARGHTPLEVIVGALFGMLIGCIVFLATK